MRFFSRLLFIYLVICLITCFFPLETDYPISGDIELLKRLSTKQQESMIRIQKEASRHWLYRYIPRHRSIIPWWGIGYWTTWALFGNDDDGLFGEGHHALYWRSDEPASCKKALLWGLRNPLHNFTFYVIGSGWTENSEVTLLKVSWNGVECCSYSPTGRTIFPEENSCLFIGLHGWKPFISLRIRYSDSSKGDFFLGWRERGNFGVKFIPWTRSRGLRNEYISSQQLQNEI